MEVKQFKQEVKKPYEAPFLERVEIDKHISLVMMSTPPDQGDPPDGGSDSPWD